MAFIFSKPRGRIATRMAAGQIEVRRSLCEFRKFAKTSNGYWLAWNPADPACVAVLPPDHPQDQPCHFIESWEDNPTIESMIEYVESGNFEVDPPRVLNLFITDASCAGRSTATGQPCDKTPYRCRECGNVGCAHLKKGQCSKQAFVGAKCLRCGTVGRIAEIRDGYPDPDKDLKAFYRQLLDGRQNQFELRFAVRHNELYGQIWIDGVRSGRAFSVNYRALFDSLCKEDEYFIFTCSCGMPYCEAMDSGLDVHFNGKEIIWEMHDPISCRTKVGGQEMKNWIVSGREYRFDRQQMVDQINEALAKARRKCKAHDYDLSQSSSEMALDVALAQVAGEPFDAKKQFHPQTKPADSLEVRIEKLPQEEDLDTFYRKLLGDCRTHIAKHGTPGGGVSLLDELEALNRAANQWAAKNGYPEVERYPQYARAREIGQEYFALGGFARMQQVCHDLQTRMAKTPRAAQDIVLVTYGWSGIGGWAA